ncbi:AAA family ATPase [Polaribacter sp.]|nr:AAA family ATPase [Polaribacter sp.]
MQRLKSITIENFRSVGEEPIEITFKDNCPTILLGENNAGKSNIIRAIELLFGEFHPKYKKLDNYDYFNRDESNKITISSKVTGFNSKLNNRGTYYNCGGFIFDSVKGSDNNFVSIQLENGEHYHYTSNAVREELLCVVVNAEQNLNYQLSYTSKFTLLSKVTKAFHDKLISDDARVGKLKGFFDSIKQTFLEVDEFKIFSDNMSAIAGQMLSNMSHALQFDFSAYDPSNYFKTLKVHPSENGETRAFEELGTGQQQILALSFAHAYAKSFLGQGLIFVLDEPEAHLHPLAQKWLAKQMYQMAKDGLQLIITTHSPYFINLEFLDSLYLVSKSEQTFVTNTNSKELADFCITTGATRADEKTIIPFYSAHSKPHILNGFFAKKIILVEGETEELALPAYFEKIGLDTLKEGIAIIGVSGKGNLAKWWRLFTCYEIPTFVCFDNDSKDDRKGNKRAEALKAIGIDEGDIAELLTNEDWNINEKFCVFGKDFETTMRNSFARYAEIELEEIDRLGSSKPIVAKAVAERILSEDINSDDSGWEQFNELKEFIEIME